MEPYIKPLSLVLLLAAMIGFPAVRREARLMLKLNVTPICDSSTRLEWLPLVDVGACATQFSRFHQRQPKLDGAV